MKGYKTVVFGLMLFSLLLTIGMMAFMPAQIPAHYDAAGAITRLGSKFESLLWPAAVGFFGFFSLLVDKIALNLGKGERLVIRILLAGVMLFFIGMGIFYMARAIQFAPPVS